MINRYEGLTVEELNTELDKVKAGMQSCSKDLYDLLKQDMRCPYIEIMTANLDKYEEFDELYKTRNKLLNDREKLLGELSAKAADAAQKAKIAAELAKTGTTEELKEAKAASVKASKEAKEAKVDAEKAKKRDFISLAKNGFGYEPLIAIGKFLYNAILAIYSILWPVVVILVYVGKLFEYIANSAVSACKSFGSKKRKTESSKAQDLEEQQKSIFEKFDLNNGFFYDFGTSFISPILAVIGVTYLTIAFTVLLLKYIVDTAVSTCKRFFAKNPAAASETLDPERAMNLEVLQNQQQASAPKVGHTGPQQKQENESVEKNSSKLSSSAGASAANTASTPAAGFTVPQSTKKHGDKVSSSSGESILGKHDRSSENVSVGKNSRVRHV